MTQNPFESPQGNPYANEAPAQATTGQFDIGQAISEGWTAMMVNAGVALGGMVIVGLLGVLAAVTIIGYVVVLPVLAYGMLRLLLNITGGEGEINDIFSGFQNYGSVLGSMLMFILTMFVVMIGVSLPGMVLAGVGGALEMPALAILGQLINLVITYAITPRLYFGPFFIADQRVGGLDALKMSWEEDRPQTRGPSCTPSLTRSRDNSRRAAPHRRRARSSTTSPYEPCALSDSIV